MEITLEKIELVKDRTGVSYREAKEALEEADGSVVDAIIDIEESIDIKGKSKFAEQSAHIVDRVKEAIKKGNVAKIIVKKDDEIILNLPLNVGIVGTVLAPWAALAGVLAAFGTKCVIELVKDDGEIIDISEIATDTFDDVVEKGSVLADEVKTKGADVFASVRSKTNEAINKAKATGDSCCCGSEEKCDDDCSCGDSSAEQEEEEVKEEATEEKQEN